MPGRPKELVAEKRILSILMVIRGEKVILDSDLAQLYGVETRRLKSEGTLKSSLKISCFNWPKRNSTTWNRKLRHQILAGVVGAHHLWFLRNTAPCRLQTCWTLNKQIRWAFLSSGRSLDSVPWPCQMRSYHGKLVNWKSAWAIMTRYWLHWFVKFEKWLTLRHQLERGDPSVS